ncbi:MAG: rod shape-determining protein MreC [Ignavibacteriaceae bacterium]
MLRFFTRLWDNFKEYIILVVLLVTSLILIPLNQKPAVKKVRTIAFGSFAVVTSLISDLVNTSSYKNENERLREINARLMLQVNKLRGYTILIDDLKPMLHYRDSTKLPLKSAEIISKSLTKSQGTITLNVGLNNNVKPGMPVINDQGIIGIIQTASDNYSIARTLNNRDLKLTVKDERSRVDAVMKWNGEDLVMIDVPKTYDIEPGDRIVTSDISTLVSTPLPVGIVKELSKVETGIFNEVKIIPFVDVVRVEHVFVLQRVESKEKNNLELNFYNRK